MNEIIYRVQDVQDETRDGRCFISRELAQEFIDASDNKANLYIEETPLIELLAMV